MTLRTTGRRIAVQGTVQGVGFRPWVLRLARELSLSGSVRNGPEGVTIDAFGPPERLEELLARLPAELPPAARIERLGWEALHDAPPAAFEILASDAGGAPRASLPADLASCDECLAEARDPAARRYEYPFTNCTRCGPRFSIATAVPYDRPNTTMAGFPMCAACRAEYEAPADRRFHAQPIACPVCGPRLSWLGRGGVAELHDGPLALAVARLTQGGIVALRGLGGFHLACDATDDAAVRELRRRKARDEKPFAVMAPSLEEAQRLAVLTAASLALLTSPARPIVLVPARPGSGLAPSVAPDASRIGLFLPYTPLHERLLALAARPLVMTSGNRSDEPMCVENDEAVRRLAGIADGFLVHDRPIAQRTDDSVARIVAGGPVLLRRARGFVPDALPSPSRFPEAVLAVGGQLKNTFCVGTGDQLVLGPHVGDLDELETLQSFSQLAERMERFLGVNAQVLAHDLHPDYASTRWALERSARLRIGVQHHHAHVAAVIAEHGLRGPVLGVAFDGTGYGPDGTAWGGELLLADAASYRRVGTLRPLGLAGGERAIREPWRVALAMLDDAFDGAPPLERLPLFAQVIERDVGNVRRLLQSGLQVTQAHGAGRWFDAVAALVLDRPGASYEAQLAIALEERAEGAVEPWPFELQQRDQLQLDLRPAVRALVEEKLAGVPQATLAARFHETLAAGTAALVRALLLQEGVRPVVLAGGCFANARLTESLLARLSGVAVHLPRRVPPGDGGLALGQAVVAAAVLAGDTEGVR